MKLATTLVAVCCALAGPSPLLARQPLPGSAASEDTLPAPQSWDDAAGPHAPASDDYWSSPPVPPLPYGFTWDSYAGADVEHDIYGYRRLHPPPRKTASCYGFLAAFADSIHVLFSYPTPYRPEPVYCTSSGGGRCVPAKFSYGTRTHIRSGCSCQADPAPVYFDPAAAAPQPQPELADEPAPPPIDVPSRPRTPQVLIDDSGLPALPLQAPQSAGTRPAPPPVLTEDPPGQLPRNIVPAPPSPLPRNKIPARGGRR
jgi:hypothetical protein